MSPTEPLSDLSHLRCHAVIDIALSSLFIESFFVDSSDRLAHPLARRSIIEASSKVASADTV